MFCLPSFSYFDHNNYIYILNIYIPFIYFVLKIFTFMHSLRGSQWLYENKFIDSNVYLSIINSIYLITLTWTQISF